MSPPSSPLIPSVLRSVDPHYQCNLSPSTPFRDPKGRPAGGSRKGRGWGRGTRGFTETKEVLRSESRGSSRTVTTLPHHPRSGREGTER